MIFGYFLGKSLLIFRYASSANNSQHIYTQSLYFVYWIVSLHPSWMGMNVRINSWNNIQNPTSLITFSFIKGLMAFSTFKIVWGILWFFKLYFKPQRQDNTSVLLLQESMVQGNFVSSRTELGSKYEKHNKFCVIAIYENAMMCYWLLSSWIFDMYCCIFICNLLW